MKKKTSSTLICQTFKIPHQTIFQDYKCSLKSGLTYFGRLYIGEQHVCFISNMFGIVKQCTIQIQNIQKIQQPLKNSLFIQEMQNGSNLVQYNFSGFKSDHAYILIKALWKKESIKSQVLNSREEDEQSMNGQSNLHAERLLDQGNVESSFFNPKAVQTDKQKLCQFQLPCSVEQYYTFFLADNATLYPRKKHLQLRESKQITITSWKKSQQLQAEVKQVNALIKVNGVPFMNFAHMSQVWQLKKNQNNQLFLDMVTQMADVPYSNYFVVNCYLSILKDGDKKCKMVVDMSIVFSKSTYMKGKILSKTILDMKQQYQFWFAQVKQLLTKMRKTQQNELKSSRSISRGSTGNNNGSDIEYQSDMPTLSSQKHIKSPIKQKLTNIDQNQRLNKLENKIQRIYKIVIIVLIIVLLQLIVNMMIVYNGNEVNQSLQIGNRNNVIQNVNIQKYVQNVQNINMMQNNNNTIQERDQSQILNTTNLNINQSQLVKNEL